MGDRRDFLESLDGRNSPGKGRPALRREILRRPAQSGDGAAVQAVRAPFRIELFGNFSIRRGDEPLNAVNTTRLQSLLAYLVLQRGMPQPREQVAFLLWPDSDEGQSRTNLRQLLHHFRRALPLECHFLEIDHQTVRWRNDPTCAVDVLEFDTALAEAEAAAKAADISTEIHALEQAARLYRDDLLPAIYDEWLRHDRDAYRQKSAQVLARLASLLEKTQNYAAAIRHVESLVAQDPLREAHHQHLIRLHMSNGDRASALRAYHQCMRVLRRELGVEPSGATRELFERALKFETAPNIPEESPQASPVSQSSLIGRKKELASLIEVWKAASGSGVHLAVISGEPGIGKSRLADELYEWCRDRKASVARARCYSAHSQVAYSPVSEWLRADPLRTACSQLPQSQIIEVARIQPKVLSDKPAMRPQPFEGSWERRHFFDALNTAFVRARKPLLLLLDDLQWCDEDSFEWLRSLFRTDSEGGVLLLGTLRSEEIGRGHPFTKLWSELRQTGRATEFALLSLTQAETVALGCQVANRPLDGRECTALYRATQGNPLFVVESVRAGLGEANGGSAMPPKVHAVIAARLAQLSASAYELAGFAAAVGQAFSLDLLLKATDWDLGSVSRAMDELWQRRIIESKGSDYDFTHDRLREVANGELSPVRKRFVHRRIARAIEEMHPGELEMVADQLAPHYASGGVPEVAIRHYRQAATVAQQRYAGSEAAAALRQALDLCRELPATTQRRQQELELLVALGKTVIVSRGYAFPDVGEISAREVALFRELKAKHMGGPVLSSSWVFHVVRGEIEVAKRISEELLRLAADDGSVVSAVVGDFALGCVRFHLGEFEESLRHMERALASHANCAPAEFELFATPAIGVTCRAYTPHLLWLLGYPDQALARSEETISAAHGSHPVGLAMALIYGAVLHVFRREGEQALRLAELARTVCERYGFDYYAYLAEILAGWASVMHGDTEHGPARLRSALESLRSTGAELRIPFYYALLGDALLHANETAEALSCISNGMAVQTKNGEVWSSPFLHIVHGDILLRDGMPEEAYAMYRNALEAAAAMGAKSLALRAATRLSTLPTADASSRELLRTLVSQFTEGLDSADLIDAQRVLGRAAER
jgi:DNA-binding SARP family transcriptional activator